MKPWWSLAYQRCYATRDFTNWYILVSKCTSQLCRTIWEFDQVDGCQLYKSYCNYSQNSDIYWIMILTWFPGDRSEFFFIKREINILPSISEQDIKSYGFNFLQTAIEQIVLHKGILIVFWLIWEFSKKYYIHNNWIRICNNLCKFSNLDIIWTKRIMAFKSYKNCFNWMKRKKVTMELNW